LNITKVTDSKYLLDLPDGLYLAKISICPYESNWAEKRWYRVCQLKCKFYKAFLKTEINQCSSCFANTIEKIQKAWQYIIGIEANVSDGNFDSAARCYEEADKIINKILDCEC
jgi:hypothetical protein